jgi:chaperonin GroES
MPRGPRFLILARTLTGGAFSLDQPSLALAERECQQRFNVQSHQKGERMKFRPLHDRVLVRRVEAEEKTAGGIIIPDSAQEKPQEGEVIAVGSGARADDGTITPLDVKAGDKILFGKWSGTEVKIDGEDLLIMKESDILGIVG